MTQEFLSPAQCRDWCSSRGLSVSPSGAVSFPPKPLHSLTIPLPTVGLEVIGLSIVLARGFEGFPTGASLLWLKSWDIWSQDFEDMGANLLCRLRRSNDLGDLPGQVFGAKEQLDLSSALLIPLLFQWDAYLIPEHARYVAFVCHDDFVNLLAGTAEDLDSLFRQLEPWKPERTLPRRIQRLS